MNRSFKFRLANGGTAEVALVINEQKLAEKLFTKLRVCRRLNENAKTTIGDGTVGLHILRIEHPPTDGQRLERNAERAAIRKNG